MAVQRGSYLHRREKSLSLRNNHIEHRELYQVHLGVKFEDIEKLLESFIPSSRGALSDFLASLYWALFWNSGQYEIDATSADDIGDGDTADDDGDDD